VFIAYFGEIKIYLKANSFILIRISTSLNNQHDHERIAGYLSICPCYCQKHIFIQRSTARSAIRVQAKSDLSGYSLS